MRVSAVFKAKVQEEVDVMRELFYSKFEALWQEIDFLKRLTKGVPGAELSRMTLWWLYLFVAEIAQENGATKEEFIESMCAAFEEVEEDMEDGDEDEEDEVYVDGSDPVCSGLSGESTPKKVTLPPGNHTVSPLSVLQDIMKNVTSPITAEERKTFDIPASGKMDNENGFDEKEIDPESFANED